MLYVHMHVLPSFSRSLTHHVLGGQDAGRNNASVFLRALTHTAGSVSIFGARMWVV